MDSETLQKQHHNNGFAIDSRRLY